MASRQMAVVPPEEAIETAARAASGLDAASDAALRASSGLRCARSTPARTVCWLLAAHCAAADVVIAAAGVPGLIKAEHVKAGAVVIDVGINRVMDEATGNRRTVGDVDQVSVLPKAAHLSPVPGGVGPLTIAMLMRNVYCAARRRAAERA